MKYCKHLDFDGNYTDCRVVERAGIRHWERGATWLTYDGAPRFVQFCKLRGRLNSPCACTSPGETKCSEYSVTDEAPPTLRTGEEKP